MSNHLTEQEISLVCAGLELPAAAASHLGECAGCRRRKAAFAATVTARRTGMRAVEPDWSAQRAAILERLGEAPAVVQVNRWRRVRRAVLAAAAVLVVGLGITLLAPRATPPQHLTDRSVEQVFAEVNQTLASDPVPGFEALEPLVPNTEELAQITKKDAS